MIDLPNTPPRRSDLAAFWFTLVLALTVAGVVVIAWLGLRAAPLMVPALVAALAGVRRDTWIASVYRLWQRMARRVVRTSLQWTTAVAFAVVWVCGRAWPTNLRLEFSPESRSGWIRRSLEAPGSRDPVDAGSQTVFGEAAGFSSLLRWAAVSRNWWVWSLLPPLALARLLNRGRDSAKVPTRNYTLY